MTEWLGGHLVARQGQSTTVTQLIFFPLIVAVISESAFIFGSHTLVSDLKGTTSCMQRNTISDVLV